MNNIDFNILRDMINVNALHALLESFSRVFGMRAGIFTPDVKRIGRSALERSVCQLIHDSKKKRTICDENHERRIKDVIKGKKAACDIQICKAGLINFCEPIYCNIKGIRTLIGVFFAGGILEEGKNISQKSISKLEKISRDHSINKSALIARFGDTDRGAKGKIDEVRKWMKALSNFIGLLVEKKSVTQQLMLDVIWASDDKQKIVNSIREDLKLSAVSLFLKRDDVPREFEDRIFLAATTDENLQEKLFSLDKDLLYYNIGKKNDIKKKLDAISYKSKEGFTGWVYDTGMTLHISNVRDKLCFPKEPYMPKWRHKVKEVSRWQEAKSYLGAPIRSDTGKVIGVIRSVRLKGKSDYSNDEIELLKGIASLIGASVSKVDLYKKYKEKTEALNQAQALFKNLVKPGVNLDKITDEMAEQLAEIHIKKGSGNWKAVYVLQHFKSSKIFRIVACYPQNLPGEHKGFQFPDNEGVIGEILRTGKPFSSPDCTKTVVKPARPWKSVIGVPIFHDNEIWGGVCLCGKRVSQKEVDTAFPKIYQFAENMSLVCQLSELLEAKDKTTRFATNVLSLNLEAHEVYKSLESARLGAYHMIERVEGDNKEIMKDLANEIDESLSWADVCLEMGKYINICKDNPNKAIDEYRNYHIPHKNRKNEVRIYGNPWEKINLSIVAQRALNRVMNLAKSSQVKIIPQISKNAGFIRGDENLLYRAFRNLLENAIIHGSKTKRKNIQVLFIVESTKNRKYTEITIKDNGSGMKPVILSNTREIYSNSTLLGRAENPPGFGSMIVAFSISIHKGIINIESNKVEGTKVFIKIPLL